MSLRLHLGDRSKDERSLIAYLGAALSKLPFERVVDLADDQGPWLEERNTKCHGVLPVLDRLAELAAPRLIWPSATARADAEEALRGFAQLRQASPFGLTPQAVTRPAPAELQLLDARWTAWRSAHPAGGFLLGEYCGLDAVFAPLALRVARDGLAVSEAARSYAQAVVATPAFQRWAEAAAEDAQSRAR